MLYLSVVRHFARYFKIHEVLFFKNERVSFVGRKYVEQYFIYNL